MARLHLSSPIRPQKARSRTSSSTFDLIEREAEVTLWIARSKLNRDIGNILNCGPRTVNKHQEQIYAKLGVENAPVAVMHILANR